MRQLANRLSAFPEVDRPVRERTGLTGGFDFRLTWVGMFVLRSDLTAGAENSKADSGPNIFAALQDQLGLKLEARTDTVNVVVIDQVEPPTED